MQKEVKVAAFEGGLLRLLAPGESGREAVLALPLNRLIVKMVAVPVDQDQVAFSAPILQAMSPFPDESLTVSCETVFESEAGKSVIAAALPESATDDIAEALDTAKLNVTRIDALEIGLLRGLWNEIYVAGDEPVRRLVMMAGADCISLIVLDGDRPSAIRAITDAGELKREVMLSLLEAEDFGGPMALKEIVFVAWGKRDAVVDNVAGASRPGTGERGETEDVAGASRPGVGASASPVALAPEALDSLAAFAPIRRLASPDPDLALVGVAERSAEAGSLDASPVSWKEVLVETRFKAKLTKYLAVTGGIWLLAIGVLFGVPIVYGFMTDYQKGLSREHQRQYAAVKAMKGKVDLVRKYSDHDRGALEIMKAVSDRLPEGMTLSSWNYKREDGLVISGEADNANDVYDLKDKLIELGDDERVFAEVNLNGPRAGRAGRQAFDIECRYEGTEE